MAEIEEVIARFESMDLLSKDQAAKVAFPRTADPNDETALAWVKHGLELDFAVDEQGRRKPRELKIPTRTGFFTFTRSLLKGGGEVKEIKMTTSLQLTRDMKFKAATLALTFCNYLNASGAQQKKIAEAAMNIVCYDHGFVKPRGKSVVDDCIKQLVGGFACDTRSDVEEGKTLGRPKGKSTTVR